MSTPSTVYRMPEIYKNPVTEATWVPDLLMSRLIMKLPRGPYMVLFISWFTVGQPVVKGEDRPTMLSRDERTFVVTDEWVSQLATAAGIPRRYARRCLHRLHRLGLLVLSKHKRQIGTRTKRFTTVTLLKPSEFTWRTLGAVNPTDFLPPFISGSGGRDGRD